MQSINNKHRMVARYLALGAPLASICDTMGLNLPTWQQIVSKPLFREEVKRISVEIDNKFVEDAINDPIHAEIKTLAREAVRQLKNELTCTDKEYLGSTAMSRIAAAKEILAMAGYKTSEEKQQSMSITFALSPEKLAAVQKSKPKES